MNELEEVYEGLKRLRLCKSGYQFSREYLGRASNYYSVAKNRKPSLAVLTTLYCSLRNQSEQLQGEKNPIITKANSELNLLTKELSTKIRKRCALDN